MPHYYAVIDFECTCWQAGDEEKKAHEIIEFPAVFMNSKTLEIEFEFHEYVRPTENPILTPFCVELTGISQATVDAADDLEAVLSTFDDFLKENKIDSFTACTDGPWDFSQFLAPEVTRKSLAVPKWARKWIDIRRRFQYTFQLTKWIGVSDMLVLLNMEFEGREHSGIDDARNIARIVKAVHKQRGKGHLKPNRSL